MLPSRAVVVLMKAIEMDREFMRQVAKAAKDDLAAHEQRVPRPLIGAPALSVTYRAFGSPRKTARLFCKT